MRKCLICKKPFNPKRSHAKTCGTACRSSLYRLEHATRKARGLPSQPEAKTERAGERQRDRAPVPEPTAPRIRRVDFERQLLMQAPPKAVRYRLLLDKETERAEHAVQSTIKEAHENFELAQGAPSLKKLRKLARQATPGRSKSLSLFPFESPSDIGLRAGRHYLVAWEDEDSNVVPAPPLMGAAQFYYFEGSPDPLGPEDEAADRVIRTNIALREELTRVRVQVRELLRTKRDLSTRIEDLEQDLHETRDEAAASLQKAKSEFHYKDFFLGMVLSVGAVGVNQVNWTNVGKGLWERLEPIIRSVEEAIQSKQSQGNGATESANTADGAASYTDREGAKPDEHRLKITEPGPFAAAVYTARTLRNMPFTEADIEQLRTAPIDTLHQQLRDELLLAASRYDPSDAMSKDTTANVWQTARSLFVGVHHLSAELLDCAESRPDVAPKGSLDRPVHRLTRIWLAHQKSIPTSGPKDNQLQAVRELLQKLDRWLIKERANAGNELGTGLLYLSVYEARDAVREALNASVAAPVSSGSDSEQV